MSPDGMRLQQSFLTRAFYSLVLVIVVLVVGTLGMHSIEGWGYLDSFYFTSFIATGQGPPPLLSPQTGDGKIFASILAFVSVGTVVTALLFIFGPFLGRVLRAGVEKVEEEVEREIENRGSSWGDPAARVPQSQVRPFPQGRTAFLRAP